MTPIITEADPHGIDAHAPGAKLVHGKVRPSLILDAMPRALMAVAEVGTYGANKYSENGWLEVPDGIKRYTDAMDRHRLKEKIEGPIDLESGTLLHAAQTAWNALARLELILRDRDIRDFSSRRFEAPGTLGMAIRQGAIGHGEIVGSGAPLMNQANPQKTGIVDPSDC